MVDEFATLEFRGQLQISTSQIFDADFVPKTASSLENRFKVAVVSILNDGAAPNDFLSEQSDYDCLVEWHLLSDA
jgi:hypothetical protein